MQNYQNSDSISFSKGVAELKQMFPNFDEEIITYVLIQNNKIFEKALDTLLVMQCVDNEPLEPEISIFKNKSPIIPNKEKEQIVSFKFIYNSIDRIKHHRPKIITFFFFKKLKQKKTLL